MTFPEATPEDVQEQQQPVVEEPVPSEEAVPDDAPEADVVEQRQEVGLDEEDAPIG
jgi:hypothetical protein